LHKGGEFLGLPLLKPRKKGGDGGEAQIIRCSKRKRGSNKRKNGKEGKRGGRKEKYARKKMRKVKKIGGLEGGDLDFGSDKGGGRKKEDFSNRFCARKKPENRKRRGRGIESSLWVRKGSKEKSKSDVLGK